MRIFPFLFLLLSFVFISCDGNIPNAKRPTRPFDPITCQSSTENQMASFSQDLSTIDSRNASDYTLSGTCKRDGADVKVYVEGHPLDKSPACNRGEWQVSANISGIVNKRKTVQLAVSQTSSGGLKCKKVDNHFICPDGYIAVSKRDNYTAEDFCVMKYEAKVKSQSDLGSAYRRKIVKAESRVDGVLISRVSEQEAIKYCEENGAGYTLINNDEWQTIGRNIEEVEANWSKGNKSIEIDNLLKVGNISGLKSSIPEQKIDDKIWNKHDRYHKLLNGEYIWDFSGNLTEIVQHKITSLSPEYRGYIYKIPQELKELFGPKRDYSIFNERDRSRGFGGLGFIQAESFSGTILRGGTGGRRASGAGVFSADTSADPNRVHFRVSVGFRCVYYP